MRQFLIPGKIKKSPNISDSSARPEPAKHAQRGMRDSVVSV